MTENEAVIPTEEMQDGQEEVLGDAEAKQKAALAELKDSISVEKQEVGSLRLKLTVTVPRETIDKRMGEQFDELRRDALIPGFRKGHAPVKLVEKRFAADVGDQLKTQLLTNGYLAAVERESLKPLGDPLFFVKARKDADSTAPGGSDGELIDKLLPVEQALDYIEFPKDGPLTFSCEVELRPEFELPSLEKIPVTKPRVAIAEKDVEEELRRIRLREGVFKPVEGGKVERDDMLYTDMKVTVENAVIFDEKSFDIAARDIMVKGIPLRGLGDALVGKKIDDVVNVSATAPDDHENLAIRGKKADFEFTIREIKRLEVPPIDEAFAKEMGYESVQNLRDTVKERLEWQLEDAVTEGLHGQLANYLIDKTKMDVPSGLSERQTNRAIARRVIDMVQRGVPDTEVKKFADEMRVKAHDQTVRELKLAFVLEKVAEDRDVEVPEEEVNSAIAMIAARTGKRFDRVRDELNRGDGIQSLYLRLRDRKIFDALLQDAAVTETEGPKT